MKKIRNFHLRNKSYKNSEFHLTTEIGSVIMAGPISAFFAKKKPGDIAPGFNIKISIIVSSYRLFSKAIPCDAFCLPAILCGQNGILMSILGEVVACYRRSSIRVELSVNSYTLSII